MASPRDWSPRGKMKKYTIIAYWEDDGEPWLYFAEGYTAKDAVKNGLFEVVNENEWTSETLKKLMIVEVVEGYRMRALDNVSVFSGYSALKGR